MHNYHFCTMFYIWHFSEIQTNVFGKGGEDGQDTAFPLLCSRPAPGRQTCAVPHGQQGPRDNGSSWPVQGPPQQGRPTRLCLGSRGVLPAGTACPRVHGETPTTSSAPWTTKPHHCDAEMSFQESLAIMKSQWLWIGYNYFSRYSFHQNKRMSCNEQFQWFIIKYKQMM